MNGTRIVQFEIEFYTTPKGDTPVQDFLNSLEAKPRAKLIGMLELLEEKGNTLREPYSKKIDKDILELRCKQGSNIYRVMYFFYYHGKIVMTNGLVKKTQKTPKSVIALARRYMNAYIERMEEKP